TADLLVFDDNDNVTIAGTLAIGPNNVEFTGDLINDTGTITATSGEVRLNGSDVHPGGSTLVVPNLAVIGASTVGVTTNGTLRVAEQLRLAASLTEADENDNVEIADSVHIIREAGGVLASVPTFLGRPSLTYRTGGAVSTGN